MSGGRLESGRAAARLLESPPVLSRGSRSRKRPARSAGKIVFGDRAAEAFDVDAEAFADLFDCVPDGFRYAGDAVLIAQELARLLVENLEGELTRLLEDLAAVAGIGVVSEVGALV